MLHKKTLHENDGTTVIFIEGSLDRSDMDGIEALGRHLLELIDQGRRRFVIDLKDVDFFGSAAIGMFVAVKSELDRLGQGSLTFANLSDRARKVFRLTQMDDTFGIK